MAIGSARQPTPSTLGRSGRTIGRLLQVDSEARAEVVVHAVEFCSLTDQLD